MTLLGLSSYILRLKLSIHSVLLTQSCRADDSKDDEFFVEQSKRQKEAFDRAKQEKNDGELALKIGSQDSSSNTSVHQLAQNNVLHGDAFSGMTCSDPWAAPSRGSSDDNTADHMHTSPQPRRSSRDDANQFMPGTYHPLLGDAPPFAEHPFCIDNIRDHRSMEASQPSEEKANSNISRAASLSVTQFSVNADLQRRLWPENASLSRSSHNSGASHSTAFDRFTPVSSLTDGSSSSVTRRNQDRDTLSNIIHMTSMFDYANGTDDSGNPLPDRLTDYLDGALHDPRVSNQELDDLLKNIRPDMDIPDQDRGTTPEGLKSSLYAHQEVALAWMKKMEAGTNKGGILADDMGLGKTITTLALLLARPGSRPRGMVSRRLVHAHC